VDLGSLRVWRNLYLGFDFPLLLAAAFLYGPLVSGVIALIGSIDVREFRRGVSLLRALFNRAQICLSVMAAGFVFQAMDGDLESWPLAFAPVIVALLVDVTVNGALVAVAQKAVSDLSWAEIPRRMMLSGGVPTFLFTYTGYGCLAAVFSFMYLHIGAWAFLAFVGPITLGREVFTRGKRLVDSAETLASREGALEKASGRIADERRDERIRIAASLHDDVLQSLYNVSLHAQVVREDLRAGRLLTLEDDVPHLVRASEAASSLLREVIHDLRKSALGRYGLRDTLKLLAEQLQDDKDVKIQQTLDFSDPDPQQQLLIYQVIREALTNAVNHSKASLITVMLCDSDEIMRLRVEDDGVGFDSRADTLGNHFGLALMKERATLAGGELVVESEPGLGTVVAAKFPKRGRS
jgi:signal transduction histidine kinase